MDTLTGGNNVDTRTQRHLTEYAAWMRKLDTPMHTKAREGVCRILNMRHRPTEPLTANTLKSRLGGIVALRSSRGYSEEEAYTHLCTVEGASALMLRGTLCHDEHLIVNGVEQACTLYEYLTEESCALLNHTREKRGYLKRTLGIAAHSEAYAYMDRLLSLFPDETRHRLGVVTTSILTRNLGRMSAVLKEKALPDTARDALHKHEAWFGKALTDVPVRSIRDNTFARGFCPDAEDAWKYSIDHGAMLAVRAQGIVVGAIKREGETTFMATETVRDAEGRHVLLAGVAYAVPTALQHAARERGSGVLDVEELAVSPARMLSVEYEGDRRRLVEGVRGAIEPFLY